MVVGVDDVLIVDVVADFFEKTVNPDQLLKSVKESHVFRFGSR